MVSFREVSAAEPAAQALLAEYFEDRALSFPAGMGKYRPAFPSADSFAAPDGVFLIAEDVDLAGEPADVGCGGVRRIAPGSLGLPRFEVKHVWLQPHLRGRGFGRLLLAELERRAAGLGAKEVVLDTNAALVPAGGLYRATGYVEIDPYNENPNATTWFAKAL